jgi:PiT family inorganic phosphate transporter
MGISNLLPVEILTDTNIYHNIALIMSLLLTAIMWNLGTWYFGIPCSSSHTLVGSILGVGVTYSFIAEKKETLEETICAAVKKISHNKKYFY